MKKYILSLILSVLLFSCLGMTAFADNSANVISEDYQTIYFHGSTYYRFNASMIEVTYFYKDATLKLSATQQEIIDNVDIYSDSSDSLLKLNINFKDGSMLTACFMREDVIDIYNKVSTAEDVVYTIDFQYPHDNQISGAKELYTATPVILDEQTLFASNSYEVYVYLQEDMGLSVGALLIANNHYYYVDYKEIGITELYDFSPYRYTTLSAYEITDPSLLENIQAGEEAYYGDDFGFFFDGNFMTTIAKSFLLIVFAVLPAVALIFFLIMAIRTKGLYRKLFATICSCTVVELILFIIVATTLY